MRKADIERITKETQIRASLNIDGKGRYDISTGVRFLDHMLELFTKHGGFDLTLAATGDLDVDQHHTVEDVGIVLGQLFAKALGDHESTPYLYAPRTNAMLQVPTMEKIGQLRQLGATEVNKDYWMVFSNKGQLVKAGDRVDVIIGRFHAVGLLVE